MSDVPLDAWIGSPIKIGTVEQVHAYGVIALAYNRLEDFLIMLFASYFPGDNQYEGEPGYICAHMLNNRQRLDLLKVLVEKEEENEELKDRVHDAIAIYEICAENRNILAHGRRDSYNFDPEVFTIRKMSSSGVLREVYFDIPLPDLRETANEFVKALNYFYDIIAFIIARPLGLDAEDEHQIFGPYYQPALPEKPQKPRKLSPRPPAKDR